jgi:hypothetical protein
MVALHWGLQVGDRGLQLIDNKFSENLAEPIGGSGAMHSEGPQTAPTWSDWRVW